MKYIRLESVITTALK